MIGSAESDRDHRYRDRSKILREPKRYRGADWSWCLRGTWSPSEILMSLSVVDSTFGPSRARSRTDDPLPFDDDSRANSPYRFLPSTGKGGTNRQSNNVTSLSIRVALPATIPVEISTDCPRERHIGTQSSRSTIRREILAPEVAHFLADDPSPGPIRQARTRSRGSSFSSRLHSRRLYRGLPSSPLAMSFISL